MPYIKGLQLGLLFEEISRDFKENPTNCLKLVRGIFEAYRDLHRKNIIHDDFNFGNLLIDQFGKIRIIDLVDLIFLKAQNGKDTHRKNPKKSAAI